MSSINYDDFVDNFTRADALNLGSNWICRNTYSVNSGSTIGGKIVSNRGRMYVGPASGIDAEFFAIPLVGILLAGPLNHFCEVRIAAHTTPGGGSNKFGVGVSGTPVAVLDHTNLVTAPGGSYWCQIRGDVGPLQMVLTRVSYNQSGQMGFTDLMALGFDTYVLSDLLRLEVRYTATSTDLTVLRNGVTKATYSDISGSRYTTGCPLLPFSMNQAGDNADYSYFHGGLL